MTLLSKKSLGQHFLTSHSILSTMCDAAKINPGDTVLEIGPGKGTLTAALLERDAIVVALEKDRRLIPLLEQHFATHIAAKKLLLKETDVLDFTPEKLFTAPYKIVANIPYYITGAILEKFLSATLQPTSMTLLVQKEVAQRIIARDNKESLLSISVKAYGTPRYIRSVARGSFSPPPKVDSAIITIDTISKKNFQNETEEKLFFNIVKAGFSHKRKMLKNNLSNIAIAHHTTPELVLEEANIDSHTRSEDLSLEKWLQVTKILGAQTS